MTYSGLLMLVIGAALAQLLFEPRDRMWAALVMPALVVAVALTLTRSAVGRRLRRGRRCCSLIKDFRLLAMLPIVGAILLPRPARRSRSG